jgi:hypothetical protein
MAIIPDNKPVKMQRCSYPGCKQLVVKGLCHIHQRQRAIIEYQVRIESGVKLPLEPTNKAAKIKFD